MHHQLIGLMALVFMFPKLIVAKTLSSYPISPNRLKPFFLVVFVFFAQTVSFAQEKSNSDNFHNIINQAILDKLYQKVAQAENDSIKTTYLMKLGTAYIYHNPDSTLNISKRGLRILEGNTASWVPDIEVQFMSFIGHSYVLKGDFDAAIGAFHEMLDKTTAWKDSNLIVESYFNLAYTYAEQERIDSAVVFDLKALKIQELMHSPDVGKSYNSIGLDYAEIKLFDLALVYYKKAIDFKKKNKQDNFLGNTYINIGNVYKNLSKNDSALYFYELALEKAEETRDSVFLIEILESIGITHSRNDNYLLAKDYLLQSIALFNYLKLPYTIKIVNSYHELAKVYIILANFEKAEDLLTKSRQILVDNKATFSTNMKQNLELSELLAWSTKDFVNARLYSRKHAILMDSLYQRDSEQKVYKLLLSYEDQLKEERIKTLEQEQKISDLKNERLDSQRRALCAALLVMLLILGVLYRLNKWRSKINLELETLNNTKDKLFSIIAHDLKNPLSAFRSITQALSDDIFDISREDLDYFMKQLNNSAHNLFDLLQNLLYWSISQSGRLEFQPQEVVLKDTANEVFSLLESSAAIKKISLKNTLSIESTAWADQKMTHTILRNLVANAIKFTSNGGSISLSASLGASEITVSVIDTGRGISPEQAKNLFSLGNNKNKRDETEGRGTGLGLILCKELVERQNGKIWLESSSPQGSIFNFTLPIHPKKA